MATNPLNAALAGWLQASLTAFSLAVYGGVIPLAGGRDAPLWRWVLVEEGLFVVFLFLGVWLTRIVLGGRRTQNWGAAAVFAAGFGLLWNWYSLTASQAIELGAHPYQGWEWTFFTWGMPLLLASVALPGVGFVGQLGVAMGLAAVAVIALAGVWLSLPNPFHHPPTGNAVAAGNRPIPRTTTPA